MLKTITINEKYIVEDGKAYAYAEGLINSKRKINGCKARKDINEKLLNLQNEKDELTKKIEELTSEMAYLQRVDNELASVGYCKINNPIYRRIDGIIQKDSNNNPIVNSYTHSETCTNKEKE